MNYFNVTAIMLASIHMRASRRENTYSDMWEYLEIKWISMACIFVGKEKEEVCVGGGGEKTTHKGGEKKRGGTTSWFLAYK